jgi:hypothetical protein
MAWNPFGGASPFIPQSIGSLFGNASSGGGYIPGFMKPAADWASSGFNENMRQWGEASQGGPQRPWDPVATAQAYGDKQNEYINQANQQNRINQYGPGGSMTFDPVTGAQTVTMNAGDQANLDASRQLGGSLFGYAGQQLGKESGIGGLPGISNGDTARQRAEDAIFSRGMSRLEPMLQQTEDRRRNQLAAQGLDMSHEAWKGDEAQMGINRNDAYHQLTTGAIIGGGQEAVRQQGMDMNAHNVGLQDIMQNQQFGRNNYQDAMGAAMGLRPGMPQFNNYNQAQAQQAPNLFGANVYADQKAREPYDARMKMWGDVAGGIGGLFSGGASAAGKILPLL